MLHKNIVQPHLTPRAEIADKIKQKLVLEIVHTLTEETAKGLRRQFRKKLKKFKEELNSFQDIIM